MSSENIRKLLRKKPVLKFFSKDEVYKVAVFLINLQLYQVERTQRMCFPVNFTKFCRTL